MSPASSTATQRRAQRARQPQRCETTRPLKVLLETLHPAQVHFFHYVIEILQSQGHEVLVVTRDKDVTIRLIEKLGWNYRCLSRRKQGLVGLGIELLVRYWQLFKLARKFKPDVMIARTGVTIGLVGALLRVPRIVQDDTEHAKLQRAIGLPFAQRILTGTGYIGEHGARQVRYRGLGQQAYLHPKYFQPSAERLLAAGVNPHEPYILLRTVSWQAAHDAGIKGISEQGVHAAIATLSKYGRVILSTEAELPDSLRAYRNPVPAEDMLSLLAFCQLYIGEGGTMAAEAAILGRPAIFCSQLRCGFLLALEEQYDLLYNFNEFSHGLAKAEELLQMPHLHQEWQHKRQHLLDETDDIPEFVVDQIKQVAGR